MSQLELWALMAKAHIIKILMEKVLKAALFYNWVNKLRVLPIFSLNIFSEALYIL